MKGNVLQRDTIQDIGLSIGLVCHEYNHDYIQRNAGNTPQHRAQIQLWDRETSTTGSGGRCVKLRAGVGQLVRHQKAGLRKVPPKVGTLAWQALRASTCHFVKSSLSSGRVKQQRLDQWRVPRNFATGQPTTWLLQGRCELELGNNLNKNKQKKRRQFARSLDPPNNELNFGLPPRRERKLRTGSTTAATTTTEPKQQKPQNKKRKENKKKAKLNQQRVQRSHP